MTPRVRCRIFRIAPLLPGYTVRVLLHIQGADAHLRGVLLTSHGHRSCVINCISNSLTIIMTTYDYSSSAGDGMLLHQQGGNRKAEEQLSDLGRISESEETDNAALRVFGVIFVRRA